MDHSEFNVEYLITNESFINYCYGLNEADVLFWEDKLKNNTELKNNIEQAKELCLLLAIKVSPADKNIQLEKLRQEISKIETGPQVKQTAKLPIRKLWAWASMAAAVLIIASVYLVNYISNAPLAATLYSQVTNSNYHFIAKTDFDERKKIELPDGTTVIMNGSSSIKLANDYNIKNRHVLLTGEAFFLVKKDHSRPFVVLTAKTATTALGTSFKVQSYPSETTASVMLATGKVKVESTRTSAIDDIKLVPGEQAVLKQGAAVIEKSTFNNATLQNWINRKLVFTDANLSQITLKFREIYGVNIIVPKNVPEQVLFTGSFNNRNPTEVLEAIGFTNHFTYKQNGNNVTLIF
jgi:transmembrane sensor